MSARHRLVAAVTAVAIALAGTAITGLPASAATTLTVSPSSLPAATAGAVYSQTFTTTGGSGQYEYSVDMGALPAGLALNDQTGVLAGTPTTSGTFTFTVSATDLLQDTVGHTSYTLVVNAATIAVAPTSLPNGSVGVSYSQAVTASGGTAPYSYALTAGALPAGLTFSPTGVISGTPAVAGTYTVVISATDSTSGGGPYAGSRSYSFTVGAPTISIAPSTLPAATAGTPYSQTMTASGGTSPYDYSLVAGTLPTGITLASAGSLAGTPTSPGNFTFTIRATDSSFGDGAPFSADRAYSVVVNAPTIVVGPASLPNPTVGTAYSQTLSASGGTAPHTFFVTSGALPAGLTLTGSGVLSGTPTSAGSFSFTVTAADANSHQGSRAYTVTSGGPSQVITPSTLPTGSAGSAYPSTQFSTTGGTSPHSYAVTGGMLPSGLTLSASGALTGTPSQAGQFSFTVASTDSSTGSGAPFPVHRSYTVTIAAPAITVAPATLPNPTVAKAYDTTLLSSGGTAPYTFAVTGGALPRGLALSSAGELSGTSTAGGTFVFTVTSTDAGGFTGARAYAVTVGTPTLTLDPSTVPAATAEADYSARLTAAGGTAPYSFAVSAGVLPSGLRLDTTSGRISGTPTVAGSFTFSVTATDSSTGTGPFDVSKSYTLSVASPAIAVGPSRLVGATAGVAYDEVLSGSGGTSPYEYAVSAGTLPTGLALSGDEIVGTPTAVGSFDFTVLATDALGFTGSRTYEVDVASPGLVVTPSLLSAGAAETPYSQTFSTTGGTSPYTYTVSDGSLPAGLSLDAASGTISGTPTTAGRFTFTVASTDSTTGVGAPFTAAQSYSVLFSAPSLTVSPSVLPAPTLASPYTQQLTTTGGQAPYAYAVAVGALPPGLTLADDGTISGTPSAPTSSYFTVTVTDAVGFSFDVDYTLTVPDVAATVATTGAARPGGSITVTASGLPTGTYTVQIDSSATVLGRVVVGDDGALSFSGALPSTLSAGRHVIELVRNDVVVATDVLVVTADPLVVPPVTTPVPPVVTAPTTPTPTTSGAPAAVSVATTSTAATGWENASGLAYTGSHPAPVLEFGGLMLLLGLAAVVSAGLRRRRQAGSTER